MPLSAQLVELRPRLQAAGMIVVEEPDYLSVRLPFFCSVRVYSDGDHLRFEGYFGIVGRVRSTTMKFGGISALAVASTHFGIGYAGVVGLLAVMSGIFDSIRWQVTEHAITRISMIEALAASVEASARQLPGYATGAMLGAARGGIATSDERTPIRERRHD
jgi:hypothetical protein